MHCCFSGHRPEVLSVLLNEKSENFLKLKDTLLKVISSSIEDGYTDFYCGMARGIDTLAAEIVLEKAVINPEIHLHAVLPCPNQDKGWKESEKLRFHQILSRCTTKVLISPIYTPSCMINRNKFMVENSSRLIAVWNGFYKGGTAQTVRYAKSCEKEIILIRPKDLSVKKI